MTGWCDGSVRSVTHARFMPSALVVTCRFNHVKSLLESQLRDTSALVLLNRLNRVIMVGCKVL